jgi:hypothetical protein
MYIKFEYNVINERIKIKLEAIFLHWESSIRETCYSLRHVII